jgi:signal transduction histidine kinase/CheY-like chemotaxis protein
VEAGRDRHPLLVVAVADEGPGIADVQGILDGTGNTGGMGVVSARRLMDGLDLTSEPGKGTRVLLTKRFPKAHTSISAREIARIGRELAHAGPLDPFEEIRSQNQELVRTMEELRQRQDELVRLKSELEDTNRGVVALYAELDEKAMHLRRADELKSRFLSNMSHELRTPLNSILALSRLLLDRTDGDLTEEQAKQVTFIRNNAQDLSELVNDLLDLGKVEAGRTTVTPNDMDVQNLFGGLRGMFRPLQTNPLVNLVFEESSDIPVIFTDEGKVSQILRNFISNALKFTEEGEVRVSAAYDDEAGEITFEVRDTGIGIAPEDQERIFEEFGQIDSPIQRKVKGTGLGLPLSKRLVHLLGGRIAVTSAPGAGSTFSLTLPAAYAGTLESADARYQPDVTRRSVVVLDADWNTALLYEKYLKGTGFQVLPARTLAEARRRIEETRPVAAVIDVQAPGGEPWELLVHLKRNEAARGIRIFAIAPPEQRQRATALGADDVFTKPVDRKRLLEAVRGAAAGRDEPYVLIVDDDAVSRYLLRELLTDTRYRILEAASGEEGLQIASERIPRIILLDLVMPGMSGSEVLDALSANDATRAIPVIIVTSKALEADERAALSQRAVAILSKDTPSRQEAVARMREALTNAERGLK